ncbi:uncharacterized protein LOC62_01G000572 [Vanrija pseudolonga]|uniref:BHLH domain-containing protein n=1 Tax=Vanrija pseudolonga TaxID=143232 RepID=A0AAF0Y3L1_9TREE|nr:hypothetical protein LOC62_01G000572 [Vanrija pseudolonga]
MSGAIKMEGFTPSARLSSPPRPVLNRPFSDGSMTVESSILSSLMDPGSSFPSISHGLSNPFDYSNMVSPHSSGIPLPSSASPHSFQPHSMFSHFNMGTENREPPVVASSLDNNASRDDRSRSQSSSRSSHVGKAPPARSRSGRKLSMNDIRPNMQQGRGRAIQPPRSLSFQTDTRPSASALLGSQRDSITGADYPFDQSFGIPIPRNDFGRPMWGGPSGSAPSVLPDNMASYGGSIDGAGLDSPVTPAQNIQSLIGDETRKQRRRECHNQVEKRRREHINAMIEELNKLLPSKFKMPLEAEVAIEDEDEEEATADSPIKKKKTKRAASTSRQQKDSAQCKGRILSDSVQYIRDLQVVNEQQSSRIRYLESLLMTNGGQPGGSSWSSQNLDDQPRRDSLSYAPDNLEAMRASPEPERLVPLNQSTWSGFNSALVFEPSPTDASSGGDMQRSTPLSSGSPETDSKDAVVWGLMDFAEEQRSADTTITHVRKDSQHELQNSLSNMELDVPLDSRRSWPGF